MHMRTVVRRAASSLLHNPPPPARAQEVFNQAEPMINYNAWSGDAALVSIVQRAQSSAKLSELGRAVGSGVWQRAATDANAHPPRLVTHDRFGNRVDRVDYHPAYHELMANQIAAGAAGFCGASETHGRASSERHVERAASMYLAYQLEPGTCCPMTMSFAATAALSTQSSEAEERSDGYAAALALALRTQQYDGRNIPWVSKAGVTVGMSMTEKQGGSDVRANTTRATPLRKDGALHAGDPFSLNGAKWFTSAPMSDAFLTLAQTSLTSSNGSSAEVLSCFIVPRWLPSGARNAGFTLQRLKDKVGDRSNASAEVECVPHKPPQAPCTAGSPGRAAALLTAPPPPPLPPPPTHAHTHTTHTHTHTLQVRQRVGDHARRAGTWGADNSRNGRADAPRLRCRKCGADATVCAAHRGARCDAQRLRRAARAAAAHGGCPGRPRARVGGRNGDGVLRRGDV